MTSHNCHIHLLKIHAHKATHTEMFISKISTAVKILPNNHGWSTKVVHKEKYYISYQFVFDSLLISVNQFYGSSHLKCRVVVLSVSCKEEVFATNGHASETISSALLQHTHTQFFLFTFPAENAAKWTQVHFNHSHRLTCVCVLFLLRYVLVGR